MLLCFTVADQWVYDFMSFFLSTSLVKPVDGTHYFECDTAIAESCVLPVLWRGVHALLSEVRLISFLQVFQFDFGQCYKVCPWSVEVDLDDETYVG